MQVEPDFNASGPARTTQLSERAGRPKATGPRASWSYLRLAISSVSCGATWNRAPTTPKSASSKIGASGSLLIATIVLDVCMPARCWIAPEMPTAMYSCGDTVTPVWPTCMLCGTQPASTTAREAPTAAPSESASFSMIAKLSALPMPRPPETTTDASDSCGREPFSSTTLSTILAPLAASEIVTDTTTSSAAPADSSGANEFGRTVMTGVPLVTLDVVVIAAPKICWKTLPSPSKPTAS